MQPQGSTLRVVQVNRAAGALGIRAGHTLAHAQALVPALQSYDDDPVGDRAQLEALALWAQCLSPVVHLEGGDSLLVDVTGCERLFHGERNLLSQAWEGVRGQGFSVRGALADTPGAAWALAHTHPESIWIAAAGRTVAELAPLPVQALRLDPATVKVLKTVGIETIATLLRVPRSSLSGRFGDSLLERIEQALGERPEVLTPYRPAVVLSSGFELGTASARLELLLEAARRALVRFCAKLQQRMLGVCQLFVTFSWTESTLSYGTRPRHLTYCLSFSEPTRSFERLAPLLAAKLEQVQLPAPIARLTLWAKEVEPLAEVQEELFATGAQDARELGVLLDRLALRLGPAALVRPESVSEHQPERAYRYVSLVGAGLRSAIRTDSRGEDQRVASVVCLQNAERHAVRPVRLLAAALKVDATSVVPDGPPVAFRLHGAHHVVRRSVGPERIETGWWRGRHLRRDYYRVTTDRGLYVWLFRDRATREWYVQGWFD